MTVARETLILASGSPIRRRLLEDVGIRFESIPADIDEAACRDEDPDERARELARRKARVVSASHPDRLVLGSDQVFCLDGVFVPKPGNREELVEKLRLLSGRWHDFHCGFALIRGGDVLSAEVARARVKIRELEEAEILDYAATKEGIGCAGGYRLEERGARLVEKVEGSHFTVLGLPLIELIDALRRLELADSVFLSSDETP
jgi:nucleoside triphosphate pyrophosphatase